MTPVYLVAHRLGNTLDGLLAATGPGIAMVECDVHLFWGRLEVRHTKTLGPIPVLWDRWYLVNPCSKRLTLPELLGRAGDDVHLMLDLKGVRPAVGGAVRRVLAAHAPGRRITVCSRNWRALERLRGTPGVRLVHSVGSPRQLRALLRRFGPSSLEGISVHADLLTRSVVKELRKRAATVMSWPVSAAEQAAQLAAWGVDGLITEQPDALGMVVSRT